MPVKKRRSKGKYVIVAIAIGFLNFVGISYAQWNDQIEITASVSTGSAAPVFCKDCQVDGVKGEGTLDISFDKESSGKRVVLNVDGRVEPDYEAFVHYCVVNTGTIPLKFDGQHIKENDGITLQLNQLTGILAPGERFYSPTGTPQMYIQMPKQLPEGIYRFELELPFRQWNY